MRGVKGKSVGVCVVGLGYVGLPTLGLIGSAGFRVFGVDLRGEVVERVRRGEDSGGKPGLVSEGMLSATTDLADGMKTAGLVSVCVQTPLLNDA